MNQLKIISALIIFLAFAGVREGIGQSSDMAYTDVKTERALSAESSTADDKEGEKSTSLIRMHPNPSRGVFTIYSPDNLVALRVVDATGKEVYKSHSKARVVSINLFNQPRGVYFICVETDSLNEKHRMIIQ